MALLTIQQQQAIKPISQNWADYVKVLGGLTNFQQIENEVEEKELKTLLGITFFQDVQNNPTTQDNAKILDAFSFTNWRNDLEYSKGLRYVLAFLVYSKYVGESFIADTFTGMVKKNREETESLSSTDIKRIQTDAREIALQEFEIIKDFLNLAENVSKYPLWYRHKSKTPYRPRFTGIKRTLL
jgi:hypothetical protein